MEDFCLVVESDISTISFVSHHGVTPASARNRRIDRTAPRSVSGEGWGRWNTPLLLLDAEQQVGLVLQAILQVERYRDVVAVVGDLVVGRTEVVGELVAPVAQVG